jgi:hypothetical protein
MCCSPGGSKSTLNHAAGPPSFAHCIYLLLRCVSLRLLLVLLQVVWVFRVQDTPGYGDDQDISRHIGMIIQHINAQNIKWLDMESARDR